MASKKAIDLLHWAMRIVLYRRIAVAIEMAAELVYFFIIILFAVALAAAGAIQSK